MAGFGNGRVFISHSQADNDRCRLLLEALRDWGIDYWIDKEELQPGDDISSVINEQLDQRDILLRVCTSNVQRSPYWVNLETNAFRTLIAEDERSRRHGKRAIISLLLDDEYKLQPLERASLYIDAAHKQDDSWLSDLHSALLHYAGVSKVGPKAGANTRSLVVDSTGSGEFNTIVAALSAARPGDRIVVREGTYYDALLITKHVEIIGDGAQGNVVLDVRDSHGITFDSTEGYIASLTIRHTGEGSWYGLHVVRGRPQIEHCDLTSHSRCCVAIRNGADPSLRWNRIHHSRNAGVFIYDNGRGVLEENEIFANAGPGVEIKSGGDPTLRRNRIQHGGQAGVLAHSAARGVLEDNDIRANSGPGVAILSGSNLVLRANRITDNQLEGVSVSDESGGDFEDNDLGSNDGGAWYIDASSQEHVRRVGN